VFAPGLIQQPWKLPDQVYGKIVARRVRNPVTGKSKDTQFGKLLSEKSQGALIGCQDDFMALLL
jgi:hypothetical protein